MRLVAPLVLTAALLGVAAPALAATGVDSTGTTYSTDTVVVPIVFPVLGRTTYSDSFLACRSGCARKHMGQDLMGAKMSPLVAACDGSVVSQRKETKVGGGNYLVIACHRGRAAGWSAVYVHINNDTPGTDDGKGTAGYAFAPGIAPGVRVLAGQLVGWRGDSGDAESTGPHLHFELRKGSGWGGTVYNAISSLRAARHLTVPSLSGPHPDGTLLRATSGQTWLLSGGQKHAISPAVLTTNGISPASAITTGATELAFYANGAAVQIRTGALVRDPSGALWRVVSGRRYPVAGTTQRVLPATAADLAVLPVTTDPQSLLTPGVVVRAAGTTYAVGADGALRTASPYALASFGWTPADVVDLPLDLALPPVVGRLALRDGTLVNVTGFGAGVASGGVFHRLLNRQEADQYGYTGRPRLTVPSSAIAGLVTAELAGQPAQQYSYR
jgi:hypothetical protein